MTTMFCLCVPVCRVHHTIISPPAPLTVSEHCDTLLSTQLHHALCHARPLHPSTSGYTGRCANSMFTLTTNFRYCRVGDLNRGPATLCACADGEQHTSLLHLNHFYLKNSESKFVSYPAAIDSLLLKLIRLRSGGHCA